MASISEIVHNPDVSVVLVRTGSSVQLNKYTFLFKYIQVHQLRTERRKCEMRNVKGT